MNAPNPTEAWLALWLGIVGARSYRTGGKTRGRVSHEVNWAH